MRKLLTIAALTLLTTACANNPTVTPGVTGNYIKNLQVSQNTLAEETVKVLEKLYPAAKTQFELQIPSQDAFGASLVAQLRARGYAIKDFMPAETTTAQEVENVIESNTSTAAPLNKTTAYPLSYVLDQGSSIYRLTVKVGEQALSRAFIEQNGELTPAGYWSRKE